MKVYIQHGKACHELDVLEDPEFVKVAALMDMMESRTGIFVRHQKLILKGKVVLPHQTLPQAQITQGSKLMLLSSVGPTLGQAAAEKAAKERAEASRLSQERLKQQKLKATERQQRQQQSDRLRAANPVESRSNNWKKTGIIALRDAQLTSLPSEVWEVAEVAKSADFANNELKLLPEELARLSNLITLHLGHNLIDNKGIPGNLFPGFPKLRTLFLNNNRLRSFPEGFLACTGLHKLVLDHNQIDSIPQEISKLTDLQHLCLDHNALDSLPESLGACSNLADLIVSNNALRSLPGSLASLQLLRRLDLDNNRLKSVPAAILVGCSSLQTLNLHKNPITIDQLRETPEFQEFDKRRQQKYSKQDYQALGLTAAFAQVKPAEASPEKLWEIDFKLMPSSGGFDEGADRA